MNSLFCRWRASSRGKRVASCLPHLMYPTKPLRTALAGPAAPRAQRPPDTHRGPNFGKMLLVFGCIGTDFCKKIVVLQHFSKSTRLASWNFWNNYLANVCKFCDICKNFAEFSQKLLIFQTDFLRKFWDCSGAKGCKSCRAWKMLSNAYFLAKFRFDTAENEPAKILQNFAKLPNLLTLTP